MALVRYFEPSNISAGGARQSFKMTIDQYQCFTLELQMKKGSLSKNGINSELLN